MLARTREADERVRVMLLRITVKEGRLSLRRRSRAPTLRRPLESSHNELLNMLCRRALSWASLFFVLFFSSVLRSSSFVHVLSLCFVRAFSLVYCDRRCFSTVTVTTCRVRDVTRPTLIKESGRDHGTVASTD